MESRAIDASHTRGCPWRMSMAQVHGDVHGDVHGMSVAYLSHIYRISIACLSRVYGMSMAPVNSLGTIRRAV
jgi:hypothetical protein